MPEGQPIAQTDQEVIRHLQETLLRAVLKNQPLPGGSEPIQLPDLSFLRGQPAIFVASENLAGPINLEEADGPVRILSEEEIAREAQARDNITYFSFQPAQETNGTIRLTLQLKIASPNQQRAFGLSGLQVSFQETGGQWLSAGEPVYFAA